ncbi:MAG TPA: 2-dehydropantoate 2-reductase [Bacillales bacterium]|nr:2-dehydropantoate 2-reductase [Bacillales bacterium]
MRIAVIGGGSIGLLFSYYFSVGEERPVVYVRRQEQAESLNNNGLTLLREGKSDTVEVRAQLFQETENIEADLVVIAVKQYDLTGMTELIHHRISREAKLLFVQNGMGHVKLMDTLPQSQVYVGIVEHGALKDGENRVKHTGVGTTKLAAFRGELETTSFTWDKLFGQDFPLEFHDDWYRLMAQKLLVNAVINPLTALYRVENGALLDKEGFRQNMRRLFDEAFGILNLDSKDRRWENVLEVCQRTASNRSSMLRDMETGWITEIDAITGYLLEKAKDGDLSLPYTTFVYDSVKGLEKTPD